MMSKILSIILSLKNYEGICIMTKIVCIILQYIWWLFFLKEGGWEGGGLEIFSEKIKQECIFFKFEI